MGSDALVRPVWVGRCDVPLVNLRANGNGGASWMDLNLVTRGGEGKGTTRAAGTVRVAMEVRTSAAGRDGSDGGDGGVEPGDETVDETVAESAVDDANEDEDEDEVDAATRSAAGEATVSSTVSSKAATFSAALAAAKRDEPAPRTPSTPTVTPTVSFATPIVVSAPSSTSSSLAASTASLRSKLVDAGRVADAAECRAFAFRAEFEFDDSSVNASSSSARTKEGSSGEPRRECTGRELSRVFGWSARTPPRHPTATVHVAGKENRPPDVGEDNRMTAPVTHHPVTHRRVTHRPARGSPVAELDSAMAAGGRAAPRTDAIDSARRALAKARVFGGERASVLGEDGSSRGAGRVEEAVERVRRVQNERRRRRGTRGTEGGEEARAGVRSGRQRVCVVVAVTLLGFDLYPSRWGASPRVHGRSKALSKKASHCALTAS